MRKGILYALVIGAAMLFSSERLDIGTLIPVETVFLYKDDDQFVVETDTGDIGMGQTIDLAVKNLHNCAVGVIYLDTADYLLVDKSTESHVKEMEKHLKPTVRIWRTDKDVELKTAAQYLNVHEEKTGRNELWERIKS